jgi:hypothetical protein
MEYSDALLEGYIDNTALDELAFAISQSVGWKRYRTLLVSNGGAVTQPFFTALSCCKCNLSNVYFIFAITHLRVPCASFFSQKIRSLSGKYCSNHEFSTIDSR